LKTTAKRFGILSFDSQTLVKHWSCSCQMVVKHWSLGSKLSEIILVYDNLMTIL